MHISGLIFSRFRINPGCFRKLGPAVAKTALLLKIVIASAIAAEVPPGWQFDVIDGVQIYVSPDEAIYLQIASQSPVDATIESRLEAILDIYSVDYDRNEIQSGAMPNGEYASYMIMGEGSAELWYVIKHRGRPVWHLSKMVVESYTDLTQEYLAVASQLIENANVPLNSDIAQLTESERQELPQQANTDQSGFSTGGAGLSSSDVRGIAYISPKLELDVFSGLFQSKGGGRWLLLNDGSAYRSPTIAPADFDVASSRQREPKRWTWWKNVAARNKAFIYKPLQPGTLLDMHVSLTKSEGLPGTTFSSTQYLKLGSNGRFETSVSSFAGSGSVTIQKNKDKNSSSSTFSGQGADVTMLNQSFSSGANADRAGRYFIDGNTIELQFDNGAVVRKLFGATESTILLDGQVYSR